MPKVKITLSAEISDLSHFWPNDPEGVTEQNIYSHLRNSLLTKLFFDLLLEKSTLKDLKKENLIIETVINDIEQKIKLGERFFDEKNGFQIEIIK